MYRTEFYFRRYADLEISKLKIFILVAAQLLRIEPEKKGGL
jgi:hypothetical protein